MKRVKNIIPALMTFLLSSCNIRFINSSDTQSSGIIDVESVTSESISSISNDGLSYDNSICSYNSQETEIINTPSLRMPAEFEQVFAVKTVWPNNVPLELYKEIAEDDNLIVLVNPNSRGKSRISEARTSLNNYGVNMENVTFYDVDLDDDYGCWVRDCSPFYIFNDGKLGAVNFNYNRPQRKEQNNLPKVIADNLSLDYYEMNITHTGGNLMQDGFGTAMSDDLVVSENGDDENYVRDQMYQYTGVDNYLITIDPQGDYIAHIDCWGKIVAPDKIIIAQLPKTNPRYLYYEQVANYFASTNCAYGYPYRVYRIEEPGGNVVAPYTNSLILNKKVLMPLGENASYNQKAIATYQEALPGYEIIGIEGLDSSTGLNWLNTDALHCRTHEIPDKNMFFIDHRQVYHDKVSVDEDIIIQTNAVAYSKKAIKNNALTLHYKINNGEWEIALMSNISGTTNFVYEVGKLPLGSEFSYYIDGEDIDGNIDVEPSCGALDPHSFVVVNTF